MRGATLASPRSGDGDDGARKSRPAERVIDSLGAPGSVACGLTTTCDRVRAGRSTGASRGFGPGMAPRGDIRIVDKEVRWPRVPCSARVARSWSRWAGSSRDDGVGRARLMDSLSTVFSMALADAAPRHTRSAIPSVVAENFSIPVSYVWMPAPARRSSGAVIRCLELPGQTGALGSSLRPPCAWRPRQVCRTGSQGGPRSARGAHRSTGR